MIKPNVIHVDGCTTNLGIIGATCNCGAEAQRDNDYKEMLGQLRILALQAIADEPEYPSDMPDELWQELNGNRENIEKAMRSTVRLTKNGITERFLQALQLEEG